MKTVLVFSGGLDSTVLLRHLLAEGAEVFCLSADYGQRHRRELDAAADLADDAGVGHAVIDLRGLFAPTALTDAGADLPDADYDPESLRATVVPNRNMVLIAAALSHASALDFDAVAFAAHAGRPHTYPDCTPAFAAAMDAAASAADFRPLRVLATFVTWTKTEVVRRGAELGVPFGRTWSCYRGGRRHCGTCGTCRDRRSAFAEAGVPDPTDYDA